MKNIPIELTVHESESLTKVVASELLLEESTSSNIQDYVLDTIILDNRRPDDEAKLSGVESDAKRESAQG